MHYMDSNPLPDDDLDTQPEKAFDLLSARIKDRDFTSVVDNDNFVSPSDAVKSQKQRHILEDILSERKSGQLTPAEARMLINSLEVAMSAADQQLSVLDLMKIHQEGLLPNSKEATNLASRFLHKSDFDSHESELRAMGITKRDESLGTMVLKIPSIPKQDDQPVPRTRSSFATRAKLALAGALFVGGGAIGYNALNPSSENGAEGDKVHDPAPISGPAVPGPATPRKPAPDTASAAPKNQRVAALNTPPTQPSTPEAQPVPKAPVPKTPTPEPTAEPQNPTTPQQAESEPAPLESREIPVTLDRSGKLNEKKSIAEWKDAGYAVTIKAGRDGGTLYVLTKPLEGKEAVFVINPENPVAKNMITARRVR